MALLRLFLASLFSLWLGAGCATAPDPARQLPQRRPKLYRTQAGDTVVLQWESEAGARYSVVYATDLGHSAVWRFLPGFEDFTGTGGTQTISFTAPVPGRTYYRLWPGGIPGPP